MRVKTLHARYRAPLRGPSPEAMDAAEAIRLRSESSSVRIALIPRPGGAPGMADLLALLRALLARCRAPLRALLCVPLLLTAASVAADDSANKPVASAKEAAKPDGPVELSGMSILGNDEAPKSLVIVPWKGSQLGDMPGLSRLLDDATQPVDKDVFLRELSYYQIRSSSK